MAMTLEEVRDWLRGREQLWLGAGDHESCEQYKAMADALDAHLTQPAQAVDVGPAGYFIETRQGEFSQADESYKDDADVFPLYRALPTSPTDKDQR